jgi:hypothetical protein
MCAGGAAPPIEFDRAGELIERGLEEARKFFDESGVRVDLQASLTRR